MPEAISNPKSFGASVSSSSNCNHFSSRSSIGR
jgi:hypothetical protein